MLFLYICNWCHERLQQTRMSWWEWLLGFGFVRAYCCPHCRARFYRPPAGLLGHTVTRDVWQEEDADSMF